MMIARPPRIGDRRRARGIQSLRRGSTRASPYRVMIVIIVVGVLGSYPLWPGIDAETGEAIKVGFF